MSKKIYYKIQIVGKLIVESPDKLDYCTCRDISIVDYGVEYLTTVANLVKKLRPGYTVTPYYVARLLNCRGEITFCAAADSPDEAKKMLFIIIPPTYVPYLQK